MPQAIHGPLHTEEMGVAQAPPMVFVHPNPMDSASWAFQMAHLSTWFHTVAIDLPGYGRSPSADPGVTLPDIAAACWEAAGRRSQQPAVLVGCSVGAYVVEYMYHHAPHRTSAVVLSGTGVNAGKASTAKRIAAFRSQGLDYRRGYVLEDFSPAFRESPLAQWWADLFAERNHHADVDTIVAMYQAMGRPDPAWLHRGLRAPVLILSGSEDKAGLTAEQLAAQLPDAELLRLPGAGHACYVEKPWDFDGSLLAFLTRRDLLPDVAR